jgi:hypothetical protein
MTIPRKEDYIFYQGEKFQVEFYFTETGKIPAKEYLDSASMEVQVKLATLVKYIAENGKLFDIGKYRQVDANEKIYEFKPKEHRFFSFFYEGGKIIITNAYIKKSNKVSKKDLGKAITMKKEYFARVKGGIYYEKN